MTSSSTAHRPSLDNPENNAHIDNAKALASRFTNLQSSLHLFTSKTLFEDKIREFNDIDGSSSSSSFGIQQPQRQTPSDILFELESQMAFVRKLKFNYLEQNAKDRYIKYIVDDDSQLVTVDENEALRRSNEVDKARLKEVKARLVERYKTIEEQAKAVEAKHKRAAELTSQFSSLTSQILDARLALSRLRTAHPSDSRMSVEAASSLLEQQTAELTMLDQQLVEAAGRVEGSKVKMQECAKDVERLRVDRAAKEAKVRELRDYDGDERVMGLYDWYSASLALHRSLFSLHESKLLAENELALTYNIDRNANPPCMITLTLLFHPNTRRLADASISSLDPAVSQIDFADLIGSHIQSNDVLGLMRGIMSRVRSS